MSATNSLGVDLYHQLAKGQGNLCLSPYSISCALAMTLSGADGETRAEMSRVLHLGAKADADSAFLALQNALSASVAKTLPIANDSKNYGGPSEPITFSVANRLFPQSGYELRPEFLARAKQFYAAPPELLDFRGNGAAATKHINDWVAQQTHDRIQNLIPSPLDAATRLVLANALYLKAPWAKDFPEGATSPQPFHVNGGAVVDVPTMRGVKFLGYKKASDHLMLALPYIGAEFQFLILLPNETNGLAALETKLTSERLAEGAKLESTEIDLHLPKFKFEPPTIKLAEELQALGMKTAFDIPAGSANFDRMAPRKPNDYLAISEVFHKTFIAVDEKGTEAAAATAVAMLSMSAAMQKPEPIEVKVDRPFLYAIQHVPSGACLFIGRVTDPRATTR
ncbi:MAG: serpin family protein [Chthoniobacterales bacterium]